MGVSVLETAEGIEQVIALVKELHGYIRDDVRRCALTPREEMAELSGGDNSYCIDLRPEKIIIEFFSRNDISFGSRVICEGLGIHDFPNSHGEIDLVFLINPVDGIRELMYDKRSAWVLTGVAPTGGQILGDIQIAVQTELPTSKQSLGSVAWAVRGKGAFEEIVDVRSFWVAQAARPLRTSTAETVSDGFASIGNFYPGSMREIADIADGLFAEVLGKDVPGSARAFVDQYFSTGGEVYLLASGRYRMVADLRPAVEAVVIAHGGKLGLCCHPDNLSTSLIAKEAGASITNEKGQPLQYPLDTQTNCSWIGYANASIRNQAEAYLLRRLASL